MGDPIFDNFIKTQVQFAGASPALAVEAGRVLLDMIGSPVILLTHSQGGGIGFDLTEARPHLVKAIVTVEPGGPQFGNVDTAKVTSGPRNPNSWGLTNNRFEYGALGSPRDGPPAIGLITQSQRWMSGRAQLMAA